MTLGEGKRKVRKLLDEYSSGGEITVDEDIEHRMTDLFDMGQKDIAQAKKIYRTAALSLTGEESYELPADLMELVSIRCDGALTERYEVIGGRLMTDDDAGELLIEYAALPATIPADAGDDFEFEVAEDAANCLPYYVAAHCLLAELVTDFSPYWQIYLQKKAQLMPSVRRSGYGGGVRQALFGRCGRWRV